MPSRARSTGAIPALALGLLGACKEGSVNTGAAFVPIVASPFGTQGCATPVGVPASATPVFSSAAIGAASQIVAVAGAEQLYLTGADGSIHLLEFVGRGAPTDTVLVAAGVIEADYLVPAGIAGPAELSGIAILDDSLLAVAEHSSNSLLHVSRIFPDDVGNLAGMPLADGGNADGVAGVIRFDFTGPVQLVSAADGALYVTDPGNHTIRRVEFGPIALAVTLAGTGAPGFADGALPLSGFDTPSGLAAGCPGQLLVTESGAGGQGGHRLRSVAVGEEAFFGGFEGESLALAGDGTAATTQGVDTAAQLDAPVGLLSTSDGFAFWVDSASGILRRYDFATGLSDCPLFVDCAAAVAAGGSFTNGGGFSLAVTSSGALYVLDGSAGTLWRVSP